MGNKRRDAKAITATVQVHTGQGEFAGGMICSTGANQVLVEVFDGTADTDPLIGIGRTTTAGESAAISPISGDEVVFHRGLYVKITGTAPKGVVYWNQHR